MSQPAPRREKIPAAYIGVYLVLGAAAIMFISICLSAVTPSRYVPAYGSDLDLKGFQIIHLRDVTRAPYHEVVVEEDGTAGWGRFPSDPTITTSFLVSGADMAALRDFARAFCADPAQFTGASAEHYEIAARCSKTEFKQGILSTDRIPPTLREILLRFPDTLQGAR